MQEIQIWKGTRWFIEGDISKYFDTIDHDVLLKILEKNIHDGRFLRLISNMLKAGYLDDWKFNQTISGTSQGGVISPLLANIYLNEFDQWLENTLIPQYTKGKRQKSNPAYNRMNAEISKARKNRDIQTAHKLEVERRNIPSVDPYDETIADADMFAMLMIFSSVLQAPKLMPRKLRRQCTISLKMSFIWNYRRKRP